MATSTIEPLSQALAARLIQGALPEELRDFDAAARAAAADFLAQTAARRTDGKPMLALEPMAGDGARRRMRLAIVNDDMPFLVDSIAAAIAARDIAIDRIIHPVIRVSRDAQGRLERIGDDGDPRESMIYIETERADARDRRDLIDDLTAALADVSAAVADWRAMQGVLIADAGGIEDVGGDSEGASLLRWFLDRHFTLLAHERWTAGAEAPGDTLGIARNARPAPILAKTSRDQAIAWFRDGGAAPLLLKSNVISPVHRRVPMDLIVLPIDEGGRIIGLSIHAGLWTSAALNAPPRAVPVLRRRLAELEAKFGFDPQGHTGKALTHALAALPHDLTIAFDAESLERLALTAMSIADRPRPKMVLIRSPLGRHLFVFAWMPRDDLTTARRVAIGNMLADASNGHVLNWSVAMEGGTVALIRYMIDLRGDGRMPDGERLDQQFGQMLRGWAPSIEAALAEPIGAARAARLALRYAGAFPAGYRTANSPEEAARDIVRIGALRGPDDRSARVSRDDATCLRMKIYRVGGPLPLSDAVPVLENFGFRVIEEVPTTLDGADRASIHDFLLERGPGAAAIGSRAATLESAIAGVLRGAAENDGLNRLMLDAGIDPQGIVLLRAWFRYLRQGGLAYGLSTVVDALGRAPALAAALVTRFTLLHDPSADGDVTAIDATIASEFDAIDAIDDDRILRAFAAVVDATLRTNAFAPAGAEALAFKLDSAKIPGLPAPLPWREIWVYSPRVEGIHLRAGPVARGGLRWSDRRDDFRTEILGLMKAQRVKNAVIVPTGAKGGFYPKQLPAPGDRDAWLAEGTESYRVFIRTLLSVTDNIVGGAVVHPEGVRVLDGDDPYFVVAADKGTATFSDVANQIAIDRGYWLGDAFASGGSHGYDHKAMGITAKGAWLSVQRHFAERGVDVQTQPIRVVGCGDMSGDVFGNGMLLSRTLKVIAAFDHRHIFVDPDPDAAASWAERDRLFQLPRSSWADYDPAVISKGGGVFPRAIKSVPLSDEMRVALGIEAAEMEPAELISAILKAPVDLIWFGGIGTYVKAARENNATVGDPANDRLRVDAESLRATAIGEGANLGVTQAARIAFAQAGGRINTDFIDNSAGVDCSDNEVNIKIALNREMVEGRLTFEDRNILLASMTEEVAHLVLEDNRLQTLALSIAEADGAQALPSYVRAIEIFETTGLLDRRVEGLASNEDLMRRGPDGQGLTRPELAVLLSTAKLALQDAIEQAGFAADPILEDDLKTAFPTGMQTRFPAAIDEHRLRGEIIATKLANRMVNRLGILHPFQLSEEEGAAPGDIAAMFVVAERLFDLPALWQAIETTDMPETGRLALFDEVAVATRSQIADLLRANPTAPTPSAVCARIGQGIARLDDQSRDLLLEEACAQSGRIASELEQAGAPRDLAMKVVRLFELDGAVGLADLGERSGIDEAELTRAFTRLGQALGLDWAQANAARIQPSDPWERLLIAGLARDFQQLRLDFLARDGHRAPGEQVDHWLAENSARVAQFKAVVDRARHAAAPNAAMLAQIASQARVLLGR